MDSIKRIYVDRISIGLIHGDTVELVNTKMKLDSLDELADALHDAWVAVRDSSSKGEPEEVERYEDYADEVDAQADAQPTWVDATPAGSGHGVDAGAGAAGGGGDFGHPAAQDTSEFSDGGAGTFHA